jgi:cytochrome c2
MASRLRLSPALLCGLAALAAPLLAQAASTGDAAKGAALFKQRCSACHTAVDDGKPHPAPTLQGVVGRKAGSLAAFKGYSPGLKALGKTWDRASLDAFLAMPAKQVPGTFMVISLPKADERQDVLAYLATLK